MEYFDSHGIPVSIGDTIVYHHARTYGNTALNKAEIVGFTKSGKPKVLDKQSYWDTPDRRFIPGAKLAYEPYEKTLMCNFAKSYPKI